MHERAAARPEVQAVGDDGVQARAEDPLQIGGQPIERRAFLCGQRTRFHSLHYLSRVVDQCDVVCGQVDRDMPVHRDRLTAGVG